jgi:hypothetical protein
MGLEADANNPFKLSKNPEELFVLREREREYSRLNLLKKRLLLKQDSASFLLNDHLHHPESSRNLHNPGDISLISMSNLSYGGASSGPNYMENKRDRSGVIRFIKDIKENKEHRGLRSLSELRTGRRILVEPEKKQEKVNIIGNYERYQ